MTITLTSDELDMLLAALDVAISSADDETGGDEDSPEVAKYERLAALQQKLAERG